MRKSILILSASLGTIFLVSGWVASLSPGGTPEQIVSLGHASIIAGSVLVAGVLISLAILETGPRGPDDAARQ